MCCSAWPAAFSRTITGTWEVLVDGRLNHVLWYQNQVGDGAATNELFRKTIFDTLVGARINNPNHTFEEFRELIEKSGIEPQDVENKVAQIQGRPPQVIAPLEAKKAKGNCLIIPLLGTWESIRLLNTFDTPNLLKDISESLVYPIAESSFSLRGPQALAGGMGGGIIFLQFDIYDIVLAQCAADIPSVLSQINPEKRPEVNNAVFDMLNSWYDCPVAVCCFNDSQSGEAKPLGFAFEPLYPDKLVVYTLDAHDGKPPDPNRMVEVDHDIFVGSYLMQSEKHAQIEYSDSIPPHLSPYVLSECLGVQMRGVLMENGDFVFSAEDVRKGIFQGLRSLPPKAPAGVPRLGHKAERDFAYIS